MCVRVCDIEFVVSADCDSFTTPISWNSVSVEADEHGLKRGVYFFARRLEVVALSGFVRLAWCVLGSVYFIGGFSYPPFFVLRMHMACGKCDATLPHLPLYYLSVLPSTATPPSPVRLKRHASGLVRLWQ